MKKDLAVYCNQCGRKIADGNDLKAPDSLHVKKIWGYFSGKDKEIHEFDLCETCYDRLLAGFALPVQAEEQKEIL